MKVFYNIAGTWRPGGMERVLANKANWLVKQGYEVFIVTTDQNGKSPFYQLDPRIKCYDLNINYEANNGKSFFNKLIHYPYKQAIHRYRLTKLLKELRPDITVSMFCNDASFVHRLKDGSKKVLEVHFSRFKRLQYGRKGVWMLADKLRSCNDVNVISKYDKFVVLTEEDKKYWGQLNNIQVIPNSRSFVADHPAALNEKRVIAVGRYCYQKAFDRLIDAWGIVSKDITDWELCLVGDGEDRAELQNKIRSLSLSDKVVLGTAETDMKAVYATASILALSSRYEGLPMVLLEAQAAGLPIVAFDCKCGPRDVVTDGEDGFLVEEGDINEMAKRLVVLIKDEALRKRMGKSAFLNSRRFSEEVVMKRWQELFSGLLDEKDNCRICRKS